MTPRLCFCFLLGMMPAGWTVRAEVPPPVRVAVVGDSDQQGLAALVTAELTHAETISLVERQDLAKVGDELALQRLAGSDAVALGKLLGADGLLFITKGPAGFQVRLTAVGLGYVLFDDQMASQTDLSQLAKSISHRVAGYASKLKLDPAKAIPFSVLNLRADYWTAESMTLERKLTLLLESGLAALPEYVVLERRHAGTVAFERSLDPADRGLLHGAYLIDGTLEMPAHDLADLTVRLRLRTPGGRQIDSTTRGSAGDLPALVGKMVVAISQAAGGSSTPLVEQTRAEAGEYLQEGLWGWRQSADEAALEALDSAELLGANIADVTAARIGVLAALVNKGMQHWDPKVDIDEPAVDKLQLAPKTDYALRALREVVRYRDDKLDLHLQAVIADDPRLAGNFSSHREAEEAVYAASKLLVMLDQAGAPRADELREALRPVTGYDPLHGKTGHGFGTGMNNGDCSEVFADSWPRNLEEELASFRLTAADQLYRPYTLELADRMGRTDWTFCARFVPGREAQRKLFEQFAQSLKDIPEDRQVYLLIQTLNYGQDSSDAAFKSFLDDLWHKREELAAARFDPAWVNASFVPRQVLDRNYGATLSLLDYDLTHATSWRFNKPVLTFLWQPRNWSPAEAAAVWKEYLAFKERATLDWAATHAQGAPDFSAFETLFLKRFPQLALVPPPTPDASQAQPSLVVTRFWNPWRYTSLGYEFFMFTMLASDDGGVWLEGSNPGQPFSLFRVGLPDFVTRIIPLPEQRHTQMLVSRRDALYMAWDTHGYNNTAGGEHQIARYDLLTSQWAARDLPPYSNCYLYNLDNSLYLFLQDRSAAGESAMTRYDWDNDKLTILSSTRRKPAQNQFDDRRPLLDARLFLGPEHRPCFNSSRQGTFYIQETSGPWPKVFDSGYPTESVTALGKTLVFGPQGEITLLDPDKAAPERLLAPPGDETALWDLPKEGKPGYNQTCWHDDSLFILEKPKAKGGRYDLLCYQRGQGRTPRRIPLEFRLDAEARARLSVKPEHAPVTWNFNQIEHPDTTVYPSDFVWFYAVRQGLYIQSANVGFWFLPYGDIDASLKAARN